jgi:hypothetical protein
VSLYPLSLQTLQCIYDYVNHNIEYASDICRIETLYTPENIIRNAYGDCDEKTTLAGAMLYTMGFEIAIVYVATENTLDFTHIYLYVIDVDHKIDDVRHVGCFIPFDPTIQNGLVGQEVRRFYKKLIMPIY